MMQALAAGLEPGKSVQRKASRSGFTLMEVLVSVLLLAIAVPVLQWWHSGSWKGTGIANRNTLASQLLDQEVREIKRQAEVAGSMPSNGTYTGGSSKGIDVSYVVADALRPDNSVIANVKKVELTATWDISGVTKTYSVTTFVAKDIPW